MRYVQAPGRISRDQLIRLLATTAATTAVAGVRAGALEASKQLVQNLRRDRPGYARVLDRLFTMLSKDLAREDKLTRDQQTQALRAAVDLFQARGLSDADLARLNLNPRAAADALLETGALKAAGLDGPTDGLARRLVRVCYDELLTDPELLPRLPGAVNRELLERSDAVLGRLDELSRQVIQSLPTASASISWPVVVGTPPLPAVALQPRDTLLDQITTPAGGVTVLAQVVAGDGGVGKSQLAAAAYRQAASGDVQVRAWIDASSRASIVSGLASIATRLGLPEAGEAESATAPRRTYLHG